MLNFCKYFFSNKFVLILTTSLFIQKHECIIHVMIKIQSIIQVNDSGGSTIDSALNYVIIWSRV